MHVRITQLDGKLPNLALMRLAHYHRERGDTVHFIKSTARDAFEPAYDRVYGSAIFQQPKSIARIEELKAQFPGAIISGTGIGSPHLTVEDVIGEHDGVSYDGYKFDGSIGFTQRGCRLKCGFCVVPRKEGKNRTVATIADIWRGAPYPKHIHLLDNDFFGQPREQWEARVQEIIDGGFQICLNQGINTRMIDDVSAAALKRMGYWDDSFKVKRLYTAWDNIGDEGRFFKGVDTLEAHGIPPSHLTVYMLIGYDKRETWERVLYRFDKMLARRIRPYPMVYGDRNGLLPLGGCNQRVAHRTLGEFQRYAIRRLYSICRFEDYDRGNRDTRGRPDLFAS
jgi:hypothetical protein